MSPPRTAWQSRWRNLTSPEKITFTMSVVSKLVRPVTRRRRVILWLRTRQPTLHQHARGREWHGTQPVDSTLSSAWDGGNLTRGGFESQRINVEGRQTCRLEDGQLQDGPCERPYRRDASIAIFVGDGSMSLSGLFKPGTCGGWTIWNVRI